MSTTTSRPQRQSYRHEASLWSGRRTRRRPRALRPRGPRRRRDGARRGYPRARPLALRRARVPGWRRSSSSTCGGWPTTRRGSSPPCRSSSRRLRPRTSRPRRRRARLARPEPGSGPGERAQRGAAQPRDRPRPAVLARVPVRRRAPRPGAARGRRRSHPVLATPTSYVGSGRYRGRDHARELFTTDLPYLGPPVADRWVTEHTLWTAAEEVTWRASSSLFSDVVVTLADVVPRLVVDSARRGAPRARLRVWDTARRAGVRGRRPHGRRRPPDRDDAGRATTRTTPSGRRTRPSTSSRSVPAAAAPACGSTCTSRRGAGHSRAGFCSAAQFISSRSMSAQPRNSDSAAQAAGCAAAPRFAAVGRSQQRAVRRARQRIV